MWQRKAARGGDGDFSTAWLIAALHGYLNAWNMLTKTKTSIISVKTSTKNFFKIFIKTHTTCRSWNPGVLLEECEGQKEEYAACLLNPDPTSGQNMSVSVKCPSYLRPENLFSKVQNYKGETHNQFQTLFPVITITLHCFASKMVKVYSTQFQTSWDEKKNTPFVAERT